MRHTIAFASALTLSAGLLSPAHAINKCTGPDGKVIYQERPCVGAAKAQEIKVEPSAKDLEGRWSSSRSKDQMTGETTCFLVSPTVSMLTRPTRYAFASVFAQFAAPATSSKAGAMTFTVQSRPSSDSLLHTDLAGTGLRVDEAPFLPFTAKGGQHAIGFAERREPELLGQFQKGKALRVRLRFWPYEQVVDSDPIPLDGFEAAAKSFLTCAAP